MNTLVLAYAGAAMPLILIFEATRQSFGLAANSEAIAVEIVRTLCGSIGLVAAVPLTTALAATFAGCAHGDAGGSGRTLAVANRARGIAGLPLGIRQRRRRKQENNDEKEEREAGSGTVAHDAPPCSVSAGNRSGDEPAF